MLTIIDRYLLRQILVTGAVMTGIGLTVLLLERMIHLFGLVANPNKALGYVGQMLLMLMPHYLGIALPAAFFFGVLLTFSRLKQDGEFVVLTAAGRSLGRLLAPVMGFAAVMTLITALILGFLTPHARYAYRALKHTVAQASLTALVLDGTFIKADGLTFFAEGSTIGAQGVELSKVFVHQVGEDGETIVVTGRNGLLATTSDENHPILVVEKGVRAEIAADGAAGDTLTFSNLSWPVDPGDERFRDRGRDQNELTLVELWTARQHATEQTKPSYAEIGAELHARLVLIASIPILPLLAAALALGGQIRGRRTGVAIGLFVLIVYHEALSFGDAMAKRDLLEPMIGLWLPFAIFALGSVYVFGRAFLGRRLLPEVPRRGSLRQSRSAA